MTFAVGAEIDTVVRDGADPVDFVSLMKPRVMSLVIFTAFAAMALAPQATHPVLAAIGLLAIAVGAGAAGALNHWYDRDIDALMRRTAGRPLPAGRVDADAALTFGIVLSVISVATLGLATNWLAAALLAGTILFYALVYTAYLKRRTPQNIVIGGAAGALPPMVGWAAMAGSLDVLPALLFLVIFLWTPPHFWALALFRREDYARAGVPMMPNVAGDAATGRQIAAYSVALVAVSLTPFLLGFAGPLYGAAASVLGLRFLILAFRVMNETRRHALASAGPLFGFSIAYLFALFAALLADAVLGAAHDG